MDAAAEKLTVLRARWDAFTPVDGLRGSCLGCGQPNGERHDQDCDWERCPHCEGQSILCGNCQGETAAEALPWLLDHIDALAARVAALEADNARLVRLADELAVERNIFRDTSAPAKRLVAAEARVASLTAAARELDAAINVYTHANKGEPGLLNYREVLRARNRLREVLGACA